MSSEISAFLQSVSEGPIYVCSSCHQTHFRDNVHQVRTLRPGKHKDLLQQCLTSFVSVNNIEWLCVPCHNDIYNNLIPKLSIANKMGFPQQPAELTLYPLEETLIAPLLPFMTIRSLPVCGHPDNGQKMIIGNVVHVPNDISSTVNSLPRTLDEMGTIPVKLKRKKSYKTSVFTQNIRPMKVITALQYLSTHSEMYKPFNILLPHEWLQHIQNSNNENKLFLEGTSHNNNDEVNNDDDQPHTSDETTLHTYDSEHGNMDTMLSQDITMDNTHSETHNTQQIADQWHTPLAPNTSLELAPGENKIPVFKEHRAEYLSFPTIFCGKERPTNAERERNVHTSDIFKAELRNIDPRVCLNIPNIFWKAKHLQIKHVTDKVTLALRRLVGSKHNKITAAQLLNEHKRNNIAHLNEGYYIFRTIRNSPPYFEAKKKEVRSMVRQLGLPTIFISLSSADTNWIPLLKCLGLLIHKTAYTDEYIAETMTFNEKCALVASHPAVCSRYFHHRVQKFFNTILLKQHSPFGHVQDFMYRVEFQKRGSPHIHGLLWVSDAPNFTHDSHEKICRYIDSCISCSVDVREEEKQYLKYQLHSKHTKSCRKIVNGKKTCRFGAPWPPMPATQILYPVDVTTHENIDDIKQNFTQISHLLNNMPDNITTFQEFLDLTALSQDDYILAIQSSLQRPKIFLKRNCKETRVNAYMKNLLHVWQANHDVQYVLDAYQCITYICDYMTKSQKGMSQLMANACDEAKDGNMSLKESVRHIGNKFINATESPVQECCFDILQLPITQSSRKKEFICTSRPEQRVSLTKSLLDLEQLNPQSTDVSYKSNIDKYMIRPKQLHSWCLADYVAKIDIHYPKTTKKNKKKIYLLRQT